MAYPTPLGYDLEACLEYNPQPGFDANDIAEVLAISEGERDGDDWRWVLRLKGKRPGAQYVFVQGGSGYTGWDCQSWATSQTAKTAKDAAKFALGENLPLTGEGPQAAGLGHMLSLLTGHYGASNKAAYDTLMRQIATKKDPSVRDEIERALGLKE